LQELQRGVRIHEHRQHLAAEQARVKRLKEHTRSNAYP
jgi:hypothetical protein